MVQTFDRPYAIWAAAWVGALALFAGCTGEDSSGLELVLMGHDPPTGSACRSIQSQPVRSVLDLWLTPKYNFHAHMLNRGSDSIILESARLDFVTPAEASFLMPTGLLLPMQGAVRSGQATTIPLNIVPAELGNILLEAPEFVERGASITVVARLEVQGSTVTGQAQSSGEFTFPLEICAGCLVGYVPGSIEANEDGSQTCGPVEGLEGDATSVPLLETCEVGQDFPVDCRICRTLHSDPEMADVVCDPMELKQ